MTTMTRRPALAADATAYLEASLDAYERRLRELLGQVDVSTLPDPETFVERGIHVRRPASSVPTLVGTVYTSGGVEAVLGITRQQVADRRTRGTLVAGRTSDGRWVFPTYQFAAGEQRADVRTVLDVLRVADPDPWSIALWFPTPKGDLDGRSPLDLLDGGEHDFVLDLAHRTADRWAA